MQRAELTLINNKNRRVGLCLTALVVGVIVYSLAVIKTRGRMPEPENLSHVQRILRGL